MNTRRLVMRLVAALLPLVLVSDCGDHATRRMPVGGIRHVFLIVLENKGFETTFGADSPAPYLSRTLASEGQLLRQYYATAHVSLPNYIALLSGQSPTPETQLDCAEYVDFVKTGELDAEGQLPGHGCVYPSEVLTLPDQLDARGLTWRGYMEDMANAVPAAPATCRHPKVDASDDTIYARAGDQYATRHDPFVYFHSILDDQAGCDRGVVPLSSLEADLADEATTPSFVFITPNLCNDGHDAPCIDGSPGGLVSADAWLAVWVPKILASPAFRASGMLLVTFDEADSDSGDETATACCSEASAPNLDRPAGIVGPGGGRIGAVVVSPFVSPGSVNDTPYNHYSLLRTFEDLFEVPHLGHAGDRGLRPFGDDVFDRTPP